MWNSCSLFPPDQLSSITIPEYVELGKNTNLDVALVHAIDTVDFNHERLGFLKRLLGKKGCTVELELLLEISARNELLTLTKPSFL